MYNDLFDKFKTKYICFYPANIVVNKQKYSWAIYIEHPFGDEKAKPLLIVGTSMKDCYDKAMEFEH